MRIPGLGIIGAAFTSLFERPFRSALTMLGIIFGVIAVFVSLSLGEGGKEKIAESLDSIDARTISVYQNWGGRRSSRAKPWQPFTENDLLEIQTLHGVYAATGGLNRTYKVVTDSSDFDVDVRGIDTSYMKAEDMELERGIRIADIDIQNSDTVAVIGSSAARSLFSTQDPVGQRVKIENIPFRIIGLVKETEGNSWGGQDVNNFILIPRTTARARLIGESRLVRQQVRNLVIVGETQDVLPALEKDIEFILRRSRGLTPNAPPDYRILNFSANRQAFAETMRTVSLVILALGGVSLVVGGVGVMNIMLANVTERTREIGLRKALGARRSDILLQFLTESVVLTVISGLIGLALGYYISQFVANIDQMEIRYSWSVIGWAFGASFVTGIISGFIPAFNASRLDPVEALRNE